MRNRPLGAQAWGSRAKGQSGMGICKVQIFGDESEFEEHKDNESKVEEQRRGRERLQREGIEWMMDDG